MQNDNERSTSRGNQIYYSFTVGRRTPILILTRKHTPALGFACTGLLNTISQTHL